jgi:CRP-like cAMP-binding protein
MEAGALPAAAAAKARWPEMVWDAVVLRGIDARARAEIEAAGRLLTLKSGDIVYRAGEPADALYVVIDGACELTAIRRGEAEASVIRRAGRGDVFGEEATVVAFGVRQMEARSAPRETTIIAEVPLTGLRRAIGRAGGGEIASRLERALKRAATVDLLRTTSFTRALAERDIEVLLDAVRHVEVPRGEHVYREGDVADNAYLVADGLLQAQTDDGGKPRVEAYLTRGDLFGDEELEDRSMRRVAVVASGPAWLLAIPRDVFLVVARRNAPALEGARRVRPLPHARGALAARHRPGLVRALRSLRVELRFDARRRHLAPRPSRRQGGGAARGRHVSAARRGRGRARGAPREGDRVGATAGPEQLPALQEPELHDRLPDRRDRP